MSSDQSDEDFCETNFCEPSPVKRCRFLPKAKDRNLQEVKKEELRKRILETERECLNVIANSLKLKDEESPEDKTVPKPSETSLFSTEGRIFFEPAQISKDDLQPFLWMNSDSKYYGMNLDEFIFHIPQLTLTTEGEEEKYKLIKFCLNLLVQETEVLGIYLLTKFLSQQFIPYEMVTFKEWGGPSLSFLICLITKSVPNYRAEDAKDLFRKACLSSLDAKTFSLTSDLRDLISACLLVFAVQFNVLSWKNLVKLLEENESTIRNLSPHFYFCFMYIIKFINTRLPPDDNKSAEMLLKLLDNLKLHFGQEKGNLSLSHYLSMEAMNRLYLLCNELKSKN